MIRTLGIFSDKTPIEERAHAPPLHGRPIILGDSRRDGGSLREEAVPRLGAGLGPRARFGQVDHTAEGEEARRGGLG